MLLMADTIYIMQYFTGVINVSTSLSSVAPSSSFADVVGVYIGSAVDVSMVVIFLSTYRNATPKTCYLETGSMKTPY